MIKRISGKVNIEWYPKTASTVFRDGQLVRWASGQLVPANATAGDFAGVTVAPLAATAANYATTDKIMVDVPNTDTVYEATVKTGTLTAAMVGGRYDLHADGDGINVSAQAKGVVTVVGFVSATKALIKINAIASQVDVPTT